MTATAAAMERTALGKVTIVGREYNVFRNWRPDQGYAYALVSGGEEIGVCNRHVYKKKRLETSWYFMGNGKTIPLVDSFALTRLDNKARHEDLDEYRELVMHLLRENRMKVRYIGRMGFEQLRRLEEDANRK
jgi:hypothetical protein